MDRTALLPHSHELDDRTGHVNLLCGSRGQKLLSMEFVVWNLNALITILMTLYLNIYMEILLNNYLRSDYCKKKSNSFKLECKLWHLKLLYIFSWNLYTKIEENYTNLTFKSFPRQTCMYIFNLKSLILRQFDKN